MRWLSAEREAVQDIWYGQVAIVTARWFLIGAGLLLTLWGADNTADVQRNTVLLVVLIAMNFFLHGRAMIERPVRREVVLASSVIDAIVISMIIASGSWHAAPGFQSPFYIFYYPVLLAFALVFSPRISLAFSGAVVAVYASICILGEPRVDFSSTGDVETLATRLVTMGATAVLATIYWRIQREWRRRQLAARPRGEE